MKKRVKNRRSVFFKRLFYSVTGSMILITLILVVTLAYTYIQLAINMTFSYNGQLLSQANYSITYIDDLAQRLSYTLRTDEKVIAYLNEEENDVQTAVRAIQSIQKHILPMPYVESVYLYNAQRDVFFSTATGMQQSSADFYDQVIAEYIAPDSDASTPPVPLS